MRWILKLVVPHEEMLKRRTEIGKQTIVRKCLVIFFENSEKFEYAETIEEEETLSLLDKEIEMIKQALIRTKGRRKLASKELGISERTLYRKIKQHKLGDINEL